MQFNTDSTQSANHRPSAFQENRPYSKMSRNILETAQYHHEERYASLCTLNNGILSVRLEQNYCMPHSATWTHTCPRYTLNTGILAVQMKGRCACLCTLNTGMLTVHSQNRYACLFTLSTGILALHIHNRYNCPCTLNTGMLAVHIQNRYVCLCTLNTGMLAVHIQNRLVCL